MGALVLQRRTLESSKGAAIERAREKDTHDAALSAFIVLRNDVSGTLSGHHLARSVRFLARCDMSDCLLGL